MKTFGALSAIALLTACSGIGSHAASVVPATVAGYQAAAKGHAKDNGQVFVSDLDNATVWICPANSKNIALGYLMPSGQLNGVSNPSQIAVGGNGTVYVANAQVDASGAGSIGVYPRGATSPAQTLRTGLNTTTGVAVDSHGNVYASNKYLASIVVFPKGKSSPSETITANLTGPDGLAVDAHDNLYIADSSANDVLELTKGSKTPRSLNLTNIARPVGVAIDGEGDLFVSNMLGAKSTVTMYAPGSTAPKATIVVPGPPYGSESTIAEPAMLSVSKPGDILMVSAPITLALVSAQEYFGYAPAVVGYVAGQTRPAWSQYMTTGYDAVFAPEK
ncbi:MAG TPA: hypothetical protein VHX17_00405 [Candidatus Cybelea sp.]|jgi:hypothetical protein|nr:hypothetical protein [Candidatus Cybelea sp.]